MLKNVLVLAQNGRVLSKSFVRKSFRSDKHLASYDSNARRNACRSSCKIFVKPLRFKSKKRELVWHIFAKFSKIKFYENPFCVHPIVTDKQVCHKSKINNLIKNVIANIFTFQGKIFGVVPVSETKHSWRLSSHFCKHCWNFSAVRSFIVSITAVWSLSMVSKWCPSRWV